MKGKVKKIFMRTCYAGGKLFVSELLSFGLLFTKGIYFVSCFKNDATK